MLKTSLRSSAAKTPKLERCASPQSWACSPVRVPSARSAAMTYAAPRKNVNGETSIRPYRIGTSSGRRVLRLLLEQLHRIPPIRRRLPAGVGRTRYVGPRGSTSRGSLGRREVRRLLLCAPRVAVRRNLRDLVSERLLGAHRLGRCPDLRMPRSRPLQRLSLPLARADAHRPDGVSRSGACFVRGARARRCLERADGEGVDSVSSFGRF